MSLVDLGLVALAWLFTYAVHSTLFLGAAWALTELRRLSPLWRDRVWKLALVGGLLTASLQLGAGIQPFGGRYALGGVELAQPITATPPGAPSSTTPPVGRVGPAGPAGLAGPTAIGRVARTGAAPTWTRPLSLQPTALEPRPADTTRGELAAAEPAGSVKWDADAIGAATGTSSWKSWLAGAWILGALIGLVLFASAWSRLFARLAGRLELKDGPLRETLDELSRRAGLRGRVRLTVSTRILAPITLGIVRREICVPMRALADLSPTEQESMLAHELGHAIRRDPAWLALCRLLEMVLVVQPLNRVARRRLQIASEVLSDDWAVRLTGRPLALASCLTEVAVWLVGAPAGRRALLAPGIASDPSPLRSRVERLLDRRRQPVTEDRALWWGPSATAALVLVALAAPGFTRTATAVDSAPEFVPEFALEDDVANAAADAPDLHPQPLEHALELDPSATLSPLQAELVETLELIERDLDVIRAEHRGIKRDFALLDEGIQGSELAGYKVLQIERQLHALGAIQEHLNELLPSVLRTLADPPSRPNDPRSLNR